MSVEVALELKEARAEPALQLWLLAALQPAVLRQVALVAVQLAALRTGELRRWRGRRRQHAAAHAEDVAETCRQTRVPSESHCIHPPPGTPGHARAATVLCKQRAAGVGTYFRPSVVKFGREAGQDRRAAQSFRCPTP